MMRGLAAPLLGDQDLEITKARIRAENEEDHKTFPKGVWEVERKQWLLAVPAWFEKWNLKVKEKDIDRAEAAVKHLSVKWQDEGDPLSKEGADVEDHTVGPALHIAFLLNNILWIFFLAFPWLVGVLMSCPEGSDDATGQKLQMAAYPPWIWLPFMCLVAGLCVGEAKAMKHSIVAQVMMGGVPKVFGCKLSYKRFLYFMLIISVCFHFDVFTNSIFMARVYKTVQCTQHVPLNVEVIWHATMARSGVRGTFIAEIPYFYWAAVAWGCLLLQPLYAYAYAYPLSHQLQDVLKLDPKTNKPEPYKGEKPEPDAVSYDPVDFGTDCSQYNVMIRSDQQHGRALQAMAESARMASVYQQDPVYMHMQSKSWQPEDVHREMQRTNFRFFIFVVETIFPPNLQASFLSMEKAISGTSDYIIFASILTSALCGIFYVKSELTTVFSYLKLVRRQKRKFDVWRTENGRTKKDVPWRELQFQAKKAWQKALRSAVICVFLAGTGLFFLCRALLTAYMGCFVCECGMWNFKGTPLSAGCVPRSVFVNSSQINYACGE